MKFLITLNMPSRKGELVHQVVCEYPCDSMEEFLSVLLTEDFILVEEFYRKPENAGFFPVGLMILNTAHIGKVKADVTRT
jgi:hypothetical protein